MVNVHKSAGVIIQDRKLLLTRKFNKDFFIGPGGKIESGETPEEALVRELKEELDIVVKKSEIEEFGVYTAPLIDDATKEIKEEVYKVKSWQGTIKPSGEIEEILWVNSSLPVHVRPGSIFEREIIPRLKKANIID